MDVRHSTFLSAVRKLSSDFRGNLAWLSSKSASLFANIKIHAAAATVQFLYAGFQVLTSVTLSSSISRSVFLVYRNAIATLLVAPISFFLERDRRPPLTLRKLSELFLCGLIGVCINQTLYLSGLYYTEAIFTSTLQNFTPALTLALAVFLRMERFRIKRRDGQAKALGTVLCAAGAIVITLYRGSSVTAGQQSILRDLPATSTLLKMYSSSFVSWQLGALCLIGNSATWAIWFVSQSTVMRDYPAQLSAMSFTYAFGTLQLAVIALCMERDMTTWASTFTEDMAAILYGGFLASGLGMTLQGWCAHRGGPVLVSAYQPLQTAVVALISAIFLNETLYLGSILGGLTIIIGLYLVVWGKWTERRLAEMSGSRKGECPPEPDSVSPTEPDDVLIEPLLDSDSSTSSSPEP